MFIWFDIDFYPYTSTHTYSHMLPNIYKLFGGRDCMVVGFTTTYAIGAYYHKRCQFESHSWRGDTTLCDKVCRLLTEGRGFFRVLWFPPLIWLTDITKILLKVALNTKTFINYFFFQSLYCMYICNRQTSGSSAALLLS